MARNAFSKLFSRLRPPDAYPGNAVADAELLRRYAEARDPAAFELLVWRHGPLVLGTCRRVTRHEADAEDAFQATFLVLARKAGGVRQSLPGWLHRTARRAALRAAGRRRVGTLTTDVPATTRSGLDADELALLDAAVDGLGERHRRVVVLCYLQGHTAEDAAAILGVPRGTVLSRLATARGRLAETLTRRGVTLPAALVTATMSFDRVAACVELTLNPRVAAPAAAIAQGVLTMMLRHQLAVTALALTLVGVTGTGVALMPRPGGTGPPVPAAAAAKKDDPAAPPAGGLKPAKEDEAAKLARTIDDLYENINARESILETRLSELRKVRPRASRAEIQAKEVLYSMIEQTIFKSEVEQRRAELMLPFLSKQLEQQRKATITDMQLLQRAGQYGNFNLRKLAGDLRTAYQMGSDGLSREYLEMSVEANASRQEEFANAKAFYLDEAKKQINDINVWFQDVNLMSTQSQIKKIEDSIKSEAETIAIYREKREKLARELAEQESFHSERIEFSSQRSQIAILKAKRNELLAQQLGVRVPASNSDELLRQVLAEMIELRAEVKRLRDGK